MAKLDWLTLGYKNIMNDANEDRKKHDWRRTDVSEEEENVLWITVINLQ